ncbi:hypothetical protein [Ramlibacter sp. PS4R-6]|uniref:hypothetical protein n=1 Tax=Ramlibacter sp. PS4R-6 TaxID=3133438 RepID=UPI0030AF20C0
MSLLWSSKRLTVVSPSQPVLLVALLGFDPGETLALESQFAECTALSAQWRVGAPERADLWIVNGRTVAVGEDETLATEGLRFRPEEARRPVAFAEPVPAMLDARFRFDFHAPESLAAMLAALAPWLSPRVVQQALIGHLIANAAHFTRSTVIHVEEHGRLLAVVNFSGDTGVATDATPAAIRRADWLLRPPSAGFVPSIFHAAPTEEVLWRFATRAEGVDVLPARYRRLPIYLRRAPRLPPEELTPDQAAIVDEIADECRTWRQLSARLGCTDRELRRDLGALYLVGAITCDPSRSLTTSPGLLAPRHAVAAEPSTNGSSAFAGAPLLAPAATGEAARLP